MSTALIRYVFGLKAYTSCFINSEVARIRGKLCQGTGFRPCEDGALVRVELTLPSFNAFLPQLFISQEEFFAIYLPSFARTMIAREDIISMVSSLNILGCMIQTQPPSLVRFVREHPELGCKLYLAVVVVLEDLSRNLCDLLVRLSTLVASQGSNPKLIVSSFLFSFFSRFDLHFWNAGVHPRSRIHLGAGFLLGFPRPDRRSSHPSNHDLPFPPSSFQKRTPLHRFSMQRRPRAGSFLGL